MIKQNTWYWARTMRTEDVLDGTISALEDFRADDDVVFADGDIDDLLAQLRQARTALEGEDVEEDEGDEGDAEEQASFVMEQAGDAINQALPDGFYWGVDGNDPSYGGIMWHYECVKCMDGVETTHDYVTY